MKVSEFKRQTAEFELRESEHRQVEERILFINSVLRTISTINQLIVKEKDRDRLLKGICERLTDIPGCYNACILLLDDAGLVKTTAEAGLGVDI